MKFGLNFTPVYPGEMGDLARVAEQAGFESLWIGEHVLVPFGGVPEGDAANFRPQRLPSFLMMALDAPEPR